MVGTLALSLVFSSFVSEPVQISRGRDPWVFRCIFEDRPHSLIVAAAPDVFFAFNTTTCAFHKVWKGSMVFQGKVYDFSQENSRSEGKVLAKSYDELFSLPNALPLPPGWTSKGVSVGKAEDGFVYNGDGGFIESPAFDLSGYDNLYVAFDERSRKGRLRVEIVDGGKVAEWFGSSTDVTNDTNWMWNFKYLLNRGQASRLRFVQVKDSDKKSVKNIRLYGDRPGWAIMGPAGLEPAEAKFEGYEVQGVRACRINFKLVGKSGSISMQVRPETMGAGNLKQWTASYSVQKSDAGVTPVLLGWNQFLDKSVQGDPVTYRGLQGMALRSGVFVVSGGLN